VILERAVAENAWQVAEGLYRILLPLPWAVPFVNAFVAESRGQFMLVDCGFQWDTGLRALGRALKAIGVPPQGLTYLVLTHRHLDHASAAASVQKRWGGRVLLHSRDIAMAPASPEEMADWAGRHGLTEDRVVRLRSRDHSLLQQLPDSTEPLDVTQPLQLGDLSFELIHVPGHCPGQVMLYERQRGWLLLADQVLNVMAPNVWALPGNGEDPLGEYLESLAKTAAVQASLILPSHGMPQQGGLREAVGAMVRFHEDLVRGVAECLTDQSQSTWEVAEALDPQRAATSHTGSSLLSEVLAALIYLARQGKAVQVSEGRWVRGDRKEAGI